MIEDLSKTDNTRRAIFRIRNLVSLFRQFKSANEQPLLWFLEIDSDTDNLPIDDDVRLNWNEAALVKIDDEIRQDWNYILKELPTRCNTLIEHYTSFFET